MSRLKEQYDSQIKAAMMKKFGYKNVMQLPKVAKIVINMSVGDAVSNSKALDAAVEDLTIIAGQKPILTRAKKSLAAWKLRAGMPIGCKVTLRGEQMYEFLDRLISIAIPRIRDFRGFTDKAFDGRGNYSLGIKEQIVFPEVDFDKIDRIRGLDITITTTAKTDEQGRALLKAFGFPFKG